MAAITATTPPIRMPNEPLLFLFMTVFQRLPPGRVPTECSANSQKSLQNSGHFVECTVHLGQGSLAKTAGHATKQESRAATAATG
jgi:hypothetical protein